MPNVTATPRRMGRTVVTELTDSVGTTEVTYTLPQLHDTLRVYNLGGTDLIVSVGNQSNVEIKGFKETAISTEIFTSFNIKAKTNQASFRVVASYRDVDEDDEKDLLKKIEFVPTFTPRKRVVKQVLTYFQSGHGFVKQSAAGIQSDDTIDYTIGSQCLKMVTDGNGSVFTRNTSIGIFDATGKQITVVVKVKDISNLTTLQLYLFSNGGTTDYYVFTLLDAPAVVYWLNNDEWATITMNFAGAQVFGTPARNNITGMQLRVIDSGAGTSVTSYWNEVAFFDEPAQGVISITMDDGWSTQYTEARRIMDRYGFPGTAYVIADIIGLSTKMTLDMLKKLRDCNGWEIAAHAYAVSVHDAKYPNVSEQEMTDDLIKLRNWLVQNGFHSGAEHFAYPGGAYNSSSLSCMRRFFGTARTISEKNHETYPVADPHRLRIVNVLNTMSLATFQSHVDRCFDNKTWLILCYHQFVDPATVGTQVTPTNFQAQMDYISSKGVTVRTVGDVVRHGI